MKNKVIFGLLLALICATIGCVLEKCSADRYKAEANKQKENVAILTSENTRYKINDSLNAIEYQALRMDRDQFKKVYEEANKELKRINNAGKKQPEKYTVITKRDSFYFPVHDTIIREDTCAGYNDRYISFLKCGDTAYIEQYDTLKQVISKEYKHRFLWFRWGVKGITQDAWSTNPRTRLTVEKFVSFEK